MTPHLENIVFFWLSVSYTFFFSVFRDAFYIFKFRKWFYLRIKSNRFFLPFARFHMFSSSFLFVLSFQYPTETSFFVLFFFFWYGLLSFFLFNSFNSRKCMRVYSTPFLFFSTATVCNSFLFFIPI
uniref:(northern house mosquito) hypothetical protein n=1 Tax=Culex pipiens TaxID=7175 RepID=A0A8D8J4E8_CULPI